MLKKSQLANTIRNQLGALQPVILEKVARSGPPQMAVGIFGVATKASVASKNAVTATEIKIIGVSSEIREIVIEIVAAPADLQINAGGTGEIMIIRAGAGAIVKSPAGVGSAIEAEMAIISPSVLNIIKILGGTGGIMMIRARIGAIAKTRADIEINTKKRRVFRGAIAAIRIAVSRIRRITIGQSGVMKETIRGGVF